MLATRPTGAFAAESVVKYSPVSNPTYPEWERELREEKAPEGLAQDLNRRLRLPVDVTITVAECDTDNAFYSPST